MLRESVSLGPAPRKPPGGCYGPLPQSGSDPLLARLPAYMPASIDSWKSEHFHRLIPVGYVESLSMGKNLIRDPNLKSYYDIVYKITRSPIFNLERFGLIMNMNLGRYDYLLNIIEQGAPSDADKLRP